MIPQQQEQVLAHLKDQPASGRMVIRINADIASWAGSAADIEVRSGDVLRIPKRRGFVLISGQAYNASAITFSPGRKAGWYLDKAGGATEIANRKEIFVIRANGSVKPGGNADGPDSHLGLHAQYCVGQAMDRERDGRDVEGISAVRQGDVRSAARGE